MPDMIIQQQCQTYNFLQAGTLVIGNSFLTDLFLLFLKIIFQILYTGYFSNQTMPKLGFVYNIELLFSKLALAPCQSRWDRQRLEIQFDLSLYILLLRATRGGTLQPIDLKIYSHLLCSTSTNHVRLSWATAVRTCSTGASGRYTAQITTDWTLRNSSNIQTSNSSSLSQQTSVPGTIAEENFHRVGRRRANRLPSSTPRRRSLRWREVNQLTGRWRGRSPG